MLLRKNKLVFVLTTIFSLVLNIRLGLQFLQGINNLAMLLAGQNQKDTFNALEK
jgi:hypothetical protein